MRKYGTRQQIFVTVFVVITIWKENSASDLFSFWYAAATKNFSWHLSFIIWFLVTGCSNEKNNFVQVNLCQKLFFLHQLTHTMTTDCSLNYKFNTWKFLAQNMGRTCCVQKLFLTFRTISVYKMFSPCSAKRRASDKDLPVWLYEICCISSGLNSASQFWLSSIFLYSVLWKRGTYTYSMTIFDIFKVNISNYSKLIISRPLVVNEGNSTVIQL